MKLFLFLALAVAFPVKAGPARILPRMTGQHIVEVTTDKPYASAEQARNQYLDEQIALGYIDGVQDASQGKAWCDTGLVVPHELRDDIILALRRLPPERLKSNAAPLIIEVLSRKFPCGGRK